MKIEDVKFGQTITIEYANGKFYSGKIERDEKNYICLELDESISCQPEGFRNLTKSKIVNVTLVKFFPVYVGN